MSFLFESIPSVVVAFEVVMLSEDDYGKKYFDLLGGPELPRAAVKDGENVAVGDYIIFLSPGDIYRCPADVFESKYREVSA